MFSFSLRQPFFDSRVFYFLLFSIPRVSCPVSCRVMSSRLVLVSKHVSTRYMHTGASSPLSLPPNSMLHVPSCVLGPFASHRPPRLASTRFDSSPPNLTNLLIPQPSQTFSPSSQQTPVQSALRSQDPPHEVSDRKSAPRPALHCLYASVNTFETLISGCAHTLLSLWSLSLWSLGTRPTPASTWGLCENLIFDFPLSFGLGGSLPKGSTSFGAFAGSYVCMRAGVRAYEACDSLNCSRLSNSPLTPLVHNLHACSHADHRHNEPIINFLCKLQATIMNFHNEPTVLARPGLDKVASCEQRAGKWVLVEY